MQYTSLVNEGSYTRDNQNGIHFRNMGVMVFNKSLKQYLKGQTPLQFIQRPEFKRFVDGEGAWKWSTDQTLLNHWLATTDIKVVDLDWRFNALFTAVEDQYLKQAYFIHFFLKDKLPNRGEDVPQLMAKVQQLIS